MADTLPSWTHGSNKDNKERAQAALSRMRKERAKAALSQIKVKAWRLETSLTRRIAICLNVLTEEERMKIMISPTPSMNATYNEEPSHRSSIMNASTIVRRTGQELDNSINSLSSLDSERQPMLLDAVQTELLNSIASVPNRRSANALTNPYGIMEDVICLAETFKSYSEASDKLIQKLLNDEEAQARLAHKEEFIESLVTDLMKAIEKRIWDLCAMQQSPLPKEWENFNFGAQVKPGYIAPADHNNECFTPILSCLEVLEAIRAKAKLSEVITPNEEEKFLGQEISPATGAVVM